jgi:hypothetical protein
VADVAVALLRGLVAVQGGMGEDAVAHRTVSRSANICFVISFRELF